MTLRTAKIGRKITDRAVLDKDGTAIVSWQVADNEESGRLLARRVAPDGRLGSLITITKLHPSRKSGFAKMIRHQRALIFVWTDAFSKKTKLKRASL